MEPEKKSSQRIDFQKAGSQREKKKPKNLGVEGKLQFAKRDRAKSKRED